MKIDYEYYASNEAERRFDDQIRSAVMEDGSKADMALYIQNQAILSMLRKMMPNIKCYHTLEGCMGWVEKEHKYMLFASEADYLDYIKEDSK